MSKLLLAVFCATGILFASSSYNGDTLAPVILAGSIVKHLGTEIQKKYPRKSCPVCKGTGKYLSGDGLKLVDCGYCEPEKGESDPQPIQHEHMPKKKGLIKSVR